MESSISNNLVYKRKKFYDYSLAILALLMPLVVKGFPLLIVSAAVVGIIYFFRAYQRLGKPKKDYYLLPYNLVRDGLKNIFQGRGAMMYMVILFIVYTVSIFFSEDTGNAIRKLVLKSCYLYFPLIFALTKWDKEKLLRVMDYFVVGCGLQVIISLVDAFVSSGYAFEWTEFSYTLLSFNLHPTYAALLVNIGLVFTTLRIALNYKETNSLKGSGWRIVLVIAFVGYVFLLSSKAGLLTLFLIAFFFIVYSRAYFKSVKITLITAFSLAFVIGGSFYFLGHTAKHRYRYMKKSITTQLETKVKPKKLSSSQKRMILWENSFEAIQNSNYLGYGVGDGKAALQLNLEKNNEELVRSLNHNSHNQYLEIMLSVGVLGLILLLSILYYSAFGFGSFNWVSLLLVLIVAVNLGLESMMEKQTGSIPIVWLLCFLASGKNIFKSVFRLN